MLQIIEYIPEWNSLLMNRLIHYYPWFLAGFFLKKIYPNIRILLYNRMNIFIGITLSLLIFSVPIVCFEIYNNHLYRTILAPICICFFLWIVSVLLCSQKHFLSIFAFFGKCSLQFYLNHLLIMLPVFFICSIIYKYSHILTLVTIFVMAVVISTIMYYVEKHVMILRILCGINSSMKVIK